MPDKPDCTITPTKSNWSASASCPCLPQAHTLQGRSYLDRLVPQSYDGESEGKGGRGGEDKNCLMIDTKELFSKVFCLIILCVEAQNQHQYGMIVDRRRGKKENC